MYVLHAYVLLCDSLKINRADHMLITRIFYVTTGWDRAFFPVPVPHPPCSYLFFKLAMKFSIVTTSSSTKSCTPTSWLLWCSAIVVAVVLCYFSSGFFDADVAVTTQLLLSLHVHTTPSHFTLFSSAGLLSVCTSQLHSQWTARPVHSMHYYYVSPTPSSHVKPVGREFSSLMGDDFFFAILRTRLFYIKHNS